MGERRLRQAGRADQQGDNEVLHGCCGSSGETVAIAP
jgi:hypothetical protein